MVTIALLVIGGVTGWWAVDRLVGGYEFPGQIEGVNLTHTGDAQDLPMVRPTGMTGEVGYYGPPVTADYIFVVLDLPEGADPNIMWERYGTLLNPQGAVVTKGLPSTARFVCLPNPLLNSSGSCLWMKGRTLYELDAPFSSVDELQPIAYSVFLESD